LLVLIPEGLYGTGTLSLVDTSSQDFMCGIIDNIHDEDYRIPHLELFQEI